MTPKPKPIQEDAPETVYAPLPFVRPSDKPMSDWTQAEWDAYYASFPSGTRFYSEDEIPDGEDLSVDDLLEGE
jgi:hypothetical protein